MKKQYKLLMFSMIFMFLFVSMSSAQGITQTNEQDRGIDISYPKFDNYYKGEEYNLTVETYNRTDGLRLINSSCELSLWNNNGKELFDSNLSGTEDYSVYIPAGSLGINETNQQLTFNLYCENSGIGGFADGVFEIQERAEGEFGFDLNNDINLIVVMLILSLGVFLYFYKNRTIGAALVMLGGFFLLFNGFQVIISFFVLALGIGGLIIDAFSDS